MGNYRFRLSDMMPNAWFYKLKDMSKSRKQYISRPLKKKTPSATTSQKSNISQPRYSYYFTTEPSKADHKFCNSPIHPKALDTHFPDPPRKSSRTRSKRKTIYKPSSKLVSSSFSAKCSCHARHNSVWNKSIPSLSPVYSTSSLESSPEPDFHESLLSDSEEEGGFVVPDCFDCQVASWSGSCNSKVSSSTTDIIIDMNDESFKRKTRKIDGFDMISQLELPPIVTKPAKFNDQTSEVTKFKRSSSKLEERKGHRSLCVKIVKEESIRTHKEQKANPIVHKSSSNSMGIRLRANTPRIGGRKIQGNVRKSQSPSRSKTLSGSFAVVKSSVDPQKDFRDSMVEMIVENNIRGSKDLEDLLACYLALNSDKYHDLIVKAFEQIWFDMTELCL